MITILEIKDFLEAHPAALSTITEDDKPNVIGVAFMKVVEDGKVVITDNYMNRTIADIADNKNVCLIIWDEHLHGYKLVGEAEYHTQGKWKLYVEDMEENRGFPAKGAIVITVSKVISSR